MPSTDMRHDLEDMPCCGRVTRPCGYRAVCNAVGMRHDLGEKLQCAVLYTMLWRTMPRLNGCSAVCKAEDLRC